jgi:hypothetical protein
MDSAPLADGVECLIEQNGFDIPLVGQLEGD